MRKIAGNIFWIGLGGAVGSGLRFLLIVLSPFEGLHWVIMMENIAGSFFLGLLVGLIGRRVVSSNPWGSFLGTGVLGSFTTFSTFSMDIIYLVENEPLSAFIYLMVSISAGLAAAISGLLTARKISSKKIKKR